VVVLGLTRADGRYVAAPGAGTVVRAGDVLIVYGRDDHLVELDERPAGPAGDAAHRAAVASHRGIADAERAADSAAETAEA
jgi:uncharacterized protein with PhoU and TrkA domain